MRRSSDATLETPVTQMIDIVFLLIIFFVVTASVDNDLVDNTISLAQAKNTKCPSQST
jgi:biopolymer transport protein ExbD